MSKTITRIWELFDERAEIAGWIAQIVAVTLIVLGFLDSWPFVVLYGTGLVTLLGMRIRRVGLDGVEVQADE